MKAWWWEKLEEKEQKETKMDNKKYTIDGDPISANELVKRACEVDHDFKCLSVKMTSMAAKILRLNGHVVDYYIKE